jgi:hypothetical protein
VKVKPAAAENAAWIATEVDSRRSPVSMWAFVLQSPCPTPRQLVAHFSPPSSWRAPPLGSPRKIFPCQAKGTDTARGVVVRRVEPDGSRRGRVPCRSTVENLLDFMTLNPMRLPRLNEREDPVA